MGHWVDWLTLILLKLRSQERALVSRQFPNQSREFTYNSGRFQTKKGLVSPKGPMSAQKGPYSCKEQQGNRQDSRALSLLLVCATFFVIFLTVGKKWLNK